MSEVRNSTELSTGTDIIDDLDRDFGASAFSQSTLHPSASLLDRTTPDAGNKTVVLTCINRQEQQGVSLKRANGRIEQDLMSAKQGVFASNQPGPHIEPDVNFTFAQMIPTLLFDVLMPIVVFFVLTHYGVSTLLALVAGGLFPAINAARSWVTSHKLQPLGIIVMSFIALGTAASLISNSVFFTQVKESILTASFGLLCFGSLISGKRPLMFYVLRQFLAGNDPIKLKWCDDTWELPAARAAYQFVTLVWGIVYLLEAFLRVLFAWFLVPAQVVVISPVMGFGVTIALIAWTRRYMTSLRERRIRAEAQLTNIRS
jgi:intracellular septation protein A